MNYFRFLLLIVDPKLYNLIINTDKITEEVVAADLIIKELETLKVPTKSLQTAPMPAAEKNRVRLIASPFIPGTRGMPRGDSRLVLHGFQ